MWSGLNYRFVVRCVAGNIAKLTAYWRCHSRNSLKKDSAPLPSRARFVQRLTNQECLEFRAKLRRLSALSTSQRFCQYVFGDGVSCQPGTVPAMFISCHFGFNGGCCSLSNFAK